MPTQRIPPTLAMSAVVLLCVGVLTPVAAQIQSRDLRVAVARAPTAPVTAVAVRVPDADFAIDGRLDEAAWQLANAALADGRPDAAVTILRKLAEFDGRRGDDARALLELLN